MRPNGRMDKIEWLIFPDILMISMAKMGSSSLKIKVSLKLEASLESMTLRMSQRNKLIALEA